MSALSMACCPGKGIGYCQATNLFAVGAVHGLGRRAWRCWTDELRAVLMPCRRRRGPARSRGGHVDKRLVVGRRPGRRCDLVTAPDVSRCWRGQARGGSPGRAGYSLLGGVIGERRSSECSVTHSVGFAVWTCSGKVVVKEAAESVWAPHSAVLIPVSSGITRPSYRTIARHGALGGRVRGHEPWCVGRPRKRPRCRPNRDDPPASTHLNATMHRYAYRSMHAHIARARGRRSLP